MTQINPDATQANYQETPYQDQSWEIVGESNDNESFVPMDVPVIPRSASITDPMFADYGGVEDPKLTTRWHSQDATAYGKSRKELEKEDEANRKSAATELERIKQEAYAAGLKDGDAKATAAAELCLKSSEERFRGIIQDLVSQITGNLQHLEAEALKLSLAVAEKVLQRSVEVNPEYIGVIVKEALSHAGSAVISRVRVSAQDLEFIEVVGISKQLVELDRTWKFEKDETIRSGCVVDTSAGEIDFRLEEAWERVKGEVVKVLR